MNSNDISFIKIKMYSLIEKMSDVEVEKAWEYLQILHYDSFIITAIKKSKRSHRPGDIFTKEEALQILLFEKEDS